MKQKSHRTFIRIKKSNENKKRCQQKSLSPEAYEQHLTLNWPLEFGQRVIQLLMQSKVSETNKLKEK